MLIRKRVSFFKFCIIILIFDLHALIRQMHKLILILQCINRTWGSQISFLVKVYFILSCSNSPYSNIKFSALVKKRAFYVLLHNTKSAGWSWIDELYHLIKLLKYLNSSSLIHISRFHQPNIRNAMFDGHPLFRSISLLNLLVSYYQFIHVIIMHFGLHKKSGGCCIKLIVVVIFWVLVLSVILL